MLDLLKDAPMTTGDLCAEFPQLNRCTVTDRRQTRRPPPLELHRSLAHQGDPRPLTLWSAAAMPPLLAPRPCLGVATAWPSRDEAAAAWPPHSALYNPRAMERSSEYKVIVIGSGPAGCTAALYLSRANLIPLVLEGIQPGGQLTITTDVENYPGFPEGILGPKLMDLMRQQAERFGAVFKMESVEKVNFRTHPFEVITDQRTYETAAVIIASGASAMQLGLPTEKHLQGFGVSYCATCDGFFFKEKEIVVVGGGDSAMEEATFLTKFASKVTVIHRREELRASKIMQERALANPKIKFVFNSMVEEVIGTKEGGITSLKIRNLQSKALSEMAAQGLFVAIGHT